jgi:hypothetical protein
VALQSVRHGQLRCVWGVSEFAQFHARARGIDAGKGALGLAVAVEEVVDVVVIVVIVIVVVYIILEIVHNTII